MITDFPILNLELSPAFFFVAVSNLCNHPSSMTIGARLKTLRRELGLSQEAMGAQGFVSAPGWIKVENGQRSPSDELIHRFISWLLRDRYVSVGEAAELLEELLVLKYLGSPSKFVRDMAKDRAAKLSSSRASILVSEEPGTYNVKQRSDHNRTKKS